MKFRKPPEKLKTDDFLRVVKLAPLVSIDLIIENNKGEVLLGMRKNEPAKGYWFVPGGRIYKNEKIAGAFERIAKDELGLKLSYDNAEFAGVSEHIYKTNFVRKPCFGTHYVVLAYRVKPGFDFDIAPDNQHNEFGWFDKRQILKNKKVHTNTRTYFEQEKTNVT